LNLNNLQQNWDGLARTNPLWAILTTGSRKGNKWEIEEFWKTGSRQVKALMEHLGSVGVKLQYPKALDFGCGVGRLTQPLAEYFDEVCGVDIAPSMIDLAKSYNQKGPRCNYYLNETDNLGIFPDASFDFVVSFITLQHMEPQYAEKYIKEFLRVLKLGGTLVFQLPARETSARRVRTLLRNNCPQLLVNLYRKFRYRTLWKMEMYSIDRAEVIGFLQRNGGTVKDVRQDDCAGGYVSFTYCVTKTRTAFAASIPKGLPSN
jgi:ubiquinone/menaquinone biosynthesis C-methylase UbiE